MVERPVLSGQIPPVAASYVARQETGLSLASLATETTTVLVDTDDRVSVNALGWLDITLRDGTS